VRPYFPADETSPSASSLKVHDFVDEWIQFLIRVRRKICAPVTECLKWFEEEAQQRFQKALTDLRRSNSIRSPMMSLSAQNDLGFKIRRSVSAASNTWLPADFIQPKRA
jgi:hypothetical protein